MASQINAVHCGFQKWCKIQVRSRFSGLSKHKEREIPTSVCGRREGCLLPLEEAIRGEMVCRWNAHFQVQPQWLPWLSTTPRRSLPGHWCDCTCPTEEWEPGSPGNRPPWESGFAVSSQKRLPTCAKQRKGALGSGHLKTQPSSHLTRSWDLSDYSHIFKNFS